MTTASTAGHGRPVTRTLPVAYGRRIHVSSPSQAHAHAVLEAAEALELYLTTDQGPTVRRRQDGRTVTEPAPGTPHEVLDPFDTVHIYQTIPTGPRGGLLTDQKQIHAYLLYPHNHPRAANVTTLHGDPVAGYGLLLHLHHRTGQHHLALTLRPAALVTNARSASITSTSVHVGAVEPVVLGAEVIRGSLTARMLSSLLITGIEATSGANPILASQLEMTGIIDLLTTTAESGRLTF